MRTCPHCGESLTKPRKPLVDAEELPAPCVPCSPKAQKHVQECEDVQAGVTAQTGKYPFDVLPVGYSFCELLSNRNKLSASACIINKKGAKRFKVISHKDLGLCEIVRVK